MNLNLTPELERVVQEMVSSGHYDTRSEAVREILRLLAQYDSDRNVDLGMALASGLEQADRGELLGGDEVIAELRSFLSEKARIRTKQ